MKDDTQAQVRVRSRQQNRYHVFIKVTLSTRRAIKLLYCPQETLYCEEDHFSWSCRPDIDYNRAPEH